MEGAADLLHIKCSVGVVSAKYMCNNTTTLYRLQYCEPSQRPNCNGEGSKGSV